MIAVSIVKSLHHILTGHPEGPHRFHSIKDQLDKYLKSQIQWIEPNPIQSAVLESVHPASYIHFIEERAEMGPGIVDYGDTYVTKSSFQDALNAVAGTLSVLDVVVNSDIKRGFAIVRPPGHHTSAQKAMGFCLFNNIAITVRKAQAMGLQRVAIVDFDVHHGNGTQDIFYADPDVLYISTHQWGIFPGTGARDQTGYGEATGSTLNIPFPAGVGNKGFNKTFDSIIEPALRRFKPEFLLVSAGYDAHFADPLASLHLSSRGYFELTSKLVEYACDLSKGRMLMVLEGGYNPDALAESVRNSCLALAKLELDRKDEATPKLIEPDIDNLIEDIQKIHSI
jgi:acetoin utilization deacetylase AcuC-like enzyme